MSDRPPSYESFRFPVPAAPRRPSTDGEATNLPPAGAGPPSPEQAIRDGIDRILKANDHSARNYATSEVTRRLGVYVDPRAWVHTPGINPPGILNDYSVHYGRVRLIWTYETSGNPRKQILVVERDCKDCGKATLTGDINSTADLTSELAAEFKCCNIQQALVDADFEAHWELGL